MPLRIGLIGDYSPEVTAHDAIPKALALAADATGSATEVTWLATETISQDGEWLASFDGLWCVPGSPYADMEGALRAIRFAREQGRPFLGTCGGFQHALIEYARNVLDMEEADHAESNPTAALALITPLSCSLVGTSGRIRLRPNSRLARYYGTEEVEEQYHCNFGLNVRYEAIFETGKLKGTGFDTEGQLRAVELEGHPFFIATLFQPERSALSGRTHPLIRAYVQTVLECRARG